MKKVSFNKFLRKSNTSGGFEFYIENSKNYSGITELMDSLYENGYKYENVNYESIDSETTYILSISVIDMDCLEFLNAIKKELTKKCKKIVIELSCYDNQEIPVEFYEFCRKESQCEMFFIDKNLIKISDDILFFDQHCWHTNMYIPNYKNEFDKLNKWSEKFKKQKKGLFLAGHIRFHKIELLNFLYENNLLDENFIWSSTDENFQPELFNEFIPEKNVETYRNFKILNRIPHYQDFNLYDKWKYHNYPAHVNFMNYFNTYFEIVPETQFYDRSIVTNGTRKTRKDWINVSEKTCKALRVDVPFIMLSKANTITLLKDRFGFDIELGFWDFNYDKIEDDNERMNEIKQRLIKILSLSDSELHEFYYEYINKKQNNDIFIQNFYKENLLKIWNKL